MIFYMKKVLTVLIANFRSNIVFDTWSIFAQMDIMEYGLVSHIYLDRIDFLQSSYLLNSFVRKVNKMCGHFNMEVWGKFQYRLHKYDSVQAFGLA